MARKRKEDAQRTRTRILASALSLFAKKGYEHTTFTDIAARLKMTKGAVYWHFESKEALLIALVDEMLEKFSRQTEAIMPKDELTFRAVADMMVENARLVVDDARGRAFFMLMRTQIRWGEESMHGVREELLTNQRFGGCARSSSPTSGSALGTRSYARSRTTRPRGARAPAWTRWRSPTCASPCGTEWCRAG